MSICDEKRGEHAEDVDHGATAVGFTADLDHLPKGYYTSPFFIGTIFAIGSGLAASTGGYGLAAPNLTLINNDIGEFLAFRFQG